jgi:3-deoxy-manno-octulosonate cytidylyltransferase (CMP-KDO synthetase)
MKPVIIIPARWGSSRFAGKPLTAMLKGADGLEKPLIERTFEAAKVLADIADIYVATDDDRIKSAAEAFGAKVLMTSVDCRNGTERVYEAAQQLEPKPDVVVNWQGDAPLTPADFITALIDAMDDQKVDVATPALRCDLESFDRFKQQRSVGLVGGTTMVLSNQGNALYFSKEVIPFTSKNYKEDDEIPVFHHVGVYAYRFSALETYCGFEPGLLEELEGLEQLRFLENSIPIKAVEVDAKGRGFWEVNNPEDIEIVSNALGA